MTPDDGRVEAVARALTRDLPGEDERWADPFWLERARAALAAIDPVPAAAPGLEHAAAVERAADLVHWHGVSADVLCGARCRRAFEAATAAVRALAQPAAAGGGDG